MLDALPQRPRNLAIRRRQCPTHAAPHITSAAMSLVLEFELMQSAAN
jgi:hypothetical protein